MARGRIPADTGGSRLTCAGSDVVGLGPAGAGDLSVGEVALAVAVSSDHRAEAFAVCSQIVEEVKERLPVWKRQTFTDGSSQWSNIA